MINNFITIIFKKVASNANSVSKLIEYSYLLCIETSLHKVPQWKPNASAYLDTEPTITNSRRKENVFRGKSELEF